ncbi:MAG: hypothetical protein IPO08_23195 [Xanthomonadales bacterium]|nr:hypothetical protein [Xanthomonadales bacterium]
MRLTLTLLLILISGLASAAIKTPPVTGYWWNPQESGRGWNIDTQNDLVVVTHFVFDTNRKPTFLQGVGAFNINTGVVEADTFAFDNGQCIGCSYTNPTATLVGRVRFEFTTSTTGRVIYPNGVTVNMFYMDYGSPTLNQKMLGMWATTWVGVTGANFTQMPFYSATTTNSNGELAAGLTVLTNAGRQAVTQFVAGIYIALFDASTSYYDLYYYVADGTTYRGLACTFPKTGTAPSVSACTGASYGFMAYSNQTARSLFPSSIVSAETPDPKAHAEEQDRLRDLEYAAAAKASVVMPEAIAKALAVPGAQTEIEATVDELIRALEAKH